MRVQHIQQADLFYVMFLTCQLMSLIIGYNYFMIFVHIFIKISLVSFYLNEKIHCHI